MAFDLRAHMQPAFLETRPASKRDYRSVLNLSSNELHHPAAEAFLQDFMARQPPEAFTRYPYFPEAVDAVAAHHGLSPQQVLLSAGSDDAIRMLLHMLAGATGRLLLHWPNYANYETYARGRGLRIHYVTYARQSPARQLESLLAAVQAQPPSLVVLSNPNGFTGECLPLEDVGRLAEACERLNHVLLVDEAYAAFAGIDHLALLPRARNLLVLRSYSKSFGSAGLRLACLFAHPELIDYVSRWKAVNSVSAPALNYLLHCLRNAAFFGQIHQDIIQARTWFARELRRSSPDWTVLASSGNFLLVDTGRQEALRACVRQLAERSIIVKELEHGPGWEACFRITVGHQPLMEHVLEQLRRADGSEEMSS
ncbi:MAG: histidinol-phosphate transaminase [Cystobacter sp.]